MNRAEFQVVLDIAWKNAKRWKWRLVSVAVLVAVAFVLHVSYSGSLESSMTHSAEGGSSLRLPYDFMVEIPAGGRVLNEAEWYRTRNTLKSHDFYESATSVTVSSFIGNFELLGLPSESRFYSLDNEQFDVQGRLCNGAAEIVLPRALAEEHNLHIGEEIAVRSWQQHPRQSGIRSASFTIVGIYDGFDLQPALVHIDAANALSAAGEPNRFMINYYHGVFQNRSRLYERMRLTYPQANIVHAELPNEMSRRLQEQIYQPGQGMLLLISLFVCIGVLTIAIMTFMERRKEIAALKTVGISNKQIVWMLVLEYSLAEAGGIFVGSIVLAIMIFSMSWLRELPTMVLLRLLLVGLLNTVVAVVLALVYPILTARVASVNQLLYSRRIPLRTTQIGHMRSPQSNLVYRERKENVRILKLPPQEEAKEILILKEPGHITKAGEVIATQETWFGFAITEWIAPCDGTVVEISLGGVVAIKPLHEDEPFYPYPADLIAFEQRQEVIMNRAIQEARQMKEEGFDYQDRRKIELDIAQRLERAARRTSRTSETVSLDLGEQPEIDYATQAREEERKRERDTAAKQRPWMAYLKPLGVMAVALLLYFGYKDQLAQHGTYYQWASITTTTVKDKMSFSGSLVQRRRAEIRNVGNAWVEELYVQNGQGVREGQVLISLSDPSLNSALEQAKANLAVLQLQYDSQFLKSNDGYAEESRNLSLGMLQQQNRLDTLSKTAERLQLLAPSAGHIVSVEARQGDELNAGGLLLTYYDPSLDTEEKQRVALLQAQEKWQLAGERIESLTVKTPVSGYVRELELDIGTEVKAQSSLLLIESPNWYEQASAAERLAYDQLNISLHQNRRSLDALNLKAEFSGTISGLNVEEGQTIASGNLIARVDGDSAFIATVSVPQSQIAAVRSGQQVELSLSSSGRNLWGEVLNVAVSGQSDPLTRNVSFAVDVLIENEATLSEGAVVSLIILSDEPGLPRLGPFRAQLRSAHQQELRAAVNATLNSLMVRNGEHVEAGQLIAVLTNDALAVEGRLTEEKLRRMSATSVVAPVSSDVRHVAVENGEWVDEGQVLLHLASSALEAAYLQAEKEYFDQREQRYANASVRVSSSGQVEELYVEGGEWVQEGQLLAILSNHDLDQQIATAELALIRLETQLQSLLQNPRSSSLEIARVKLEQGRLAVEIAQRHLDQLTLRAPCDGVFVQARELRPGQYLSKSQLLATVGSEQLQMSSFVKEVDIGRIRAGMEADVDILSYPDDVFRAQVKEVADVGIATEQGVIFPVIFDIEDDQRLMSSMSATVHVKLREVRNVLAVPRSCLLDRHVEDGDESRIHLLMSGRLVETPIVVGMVTDELVEVVLGVREGDVVVAEMTEYTEQIREQRSFESKIEEMLREGRIMLLRLIYALTRG